MAKKATKEEFILKAKKVHGERYDYSKVDYIKNHNHIIVICKKHGEFKISSHNHKKGKGCPKCNYSNGERKINNFLLKNNILFEDQYRFNDCKNIKPLPFDFYLPDYNLCIEYNGRQHYEPVTHFGGEESLKSTQKRDKIKKDYCNNDNNPNLLIIKYNEDITKALLNGIPLIR